jgi:hypothetical protein
MGRWYKNYMITHVCSVFRAAYFVSCTFFFIRVINSKVIAWAVFLKTTCIINEPTNLKMAMVLRDR